MGTALAQQQSSVVAFEHPKAAANRVSRVAAALKEQAEHERERNLIATHKLRFLHVQRDMSRTPMTIAYQKSKRGKANDCIIKVAVAYLHPNDCYNKRIGRRVAASKFDSGHYIQHKLVYGLTPVQSLLHTFVY
jgi:hypothetical protein